MLKNLFSSNTKALVQDYSDAFDRLLREFGHWAAGDTLVVVHRIWEDLAPKVNDLRASFPSIPCHACPISEMQVTR